jgi:hypothetical protein
MNTRILQTLAISLLDKQAFSYWSVKRAVGYGERHIPNRPGRFVREHPVNQGNYFALEV